MTVAVADGPTLDTAADALGIDRGTRRTMSAVARDRSPLHVPGGLDAADETHRTPPSGLAPACASCSPRPRRPHPPSHPPGAARRLALAAGIAAALARARALPEPARHLTHHEQDP